MNRARSNSHVWLLAITALLGAGPGRTQAKADVGAALEEVVVTAQKRVEKLRDVPIAITVVSAEQLADQRIYSIQDLARTAPALEMIQAFGAAGGGGQIRGIGTNSFTRSAEGAVGIVIDGVPQGNVNGNDLYDIARVEVLRGPQGTLFGLTASAGVINMVTVAPDPKAFGASTHLDYADKGTLGSVYGQQTLRGSLNFPLGDGSALRIGASANYLKGVERNAFTGKDHTLHDAGVRARYLWASDTLTVNLIGDYDHTTQNYNDPQFVYVDVPAGSDLATQLAACGIVASWSNQARCSSQLENLGIINYGFSAQFDWRLGQYTLTSITGYRKNEQQPSNADIMSNPLEFSQIFQTGAIDAARQLSQELRIASPTGRALEYVAGLFLADYKDNAGRTPGGAFQVGTNFFGPTFFNFVKDGSSTQTTNKSYAAFGELTYRLTDPLSLIAGLRYTHTSITDAQSINPFDNTSIAQYGELSDNNISGRLGLRYRFSPAATGYATVTRGYKGPQVTPANLGVGATVIDAEIPLAYELGLKNEVLDGRLSFDLSAFYSKVKDYQGQRCVLNAVGALACTGESIPSVTTKGVEIDAYGRPVAGLSLNAGFIYDVAQFPAGWTGFNPNDLRDPTKGPGFGITDMSNLQLVGAPKIKFTLSGEYAHGLGALEGFFGADTVYKSALRLGFSGDPRFVYPAHWMLSARLGMRSADKRWSAELFARNLTNEHEPATIFGGPSFTGPDATVPTNGHVNGISGWVVPTSLRLLGISVEVKF